MGTLLYKLSSQSLNNLLKYLQTKIGNTVAVSCITNSSNSNYYIVYKYLFIKFYTEYICI